MLLARQDFDSDGKLVAAQLNYWEIYRNDVNTGSDLYGAWARLVRTTNTSDGLTQDTYSLFDQLDLDHDGKLLGWAQTSLGQGQTGCLIHSLHAEGDNVLYKGACSLWNVEKITFRE